FGSRLSRLSLDELSQSCRLVFQVYTGGDVGDGVDAGGAVGAGFGDAGGEGFQDLLARRVKDEMETLEHPANLLCRGLRDLPHADLVVRCRAGLLVIGGEFFVKLFAGSDAGDLDLDVLIGPQPSAADHFGGEVEDANRFAHIKDEDLPTLS